MWSRRSGCTALCAAVAVGLLANVSLATQQPDPYTGALTFDSAADAPPYTISTTACDAGDCETVTETCVSAVCEITTHTGSDNGTGAAAATEGTENDAVVTTTCTTTACSTSTTLTFCNALADCEQLRYEGLPPYWDGREPVPGPIAFSAAGDPHCHCIAATAAAIAVAATVYAL